MSNQVEFFFEPRIVQEGDLWAAFCDELALASSGASEEEATANLTATLQAFARSLKKRGLLESALDEAGLIWRSVQNEGIRVTA